MDWIKVKIKHAEYDYADFSDCEFRAWIRIMLLTAIIEREPTEQELSKHIHHKTLKSLQEKLKDRSRNGQGTLKDIIRKVLEDVEYTQHLKVKNRSRIAEYRHKKSLCNTLQLPVTLPVTLQGKIREDKIREDNISPKSYFYLTYEKILKKSYIPREAKDFEVFDDLKGKLPDDKVIALIDKFFKSDDEFIKGSDYSVQVFRGVINKLQQEKSTKRVVPV